MANCLVCVVSTQDIAIKYKELWLDSGCGYLKQPCLIEVYSNGLEITLTRSRQSITLGLLPSENIKPILKIEEQSDYPLRLLFDYLTAIEQGHLHIELIDGKLSYTSFLEVKSSN